MAAGGTSGHSGGAGGVSGATIVQGRSGGSMLCAIVIADGVAATHPLPPEAEVVVGRAAECDIRVDHASISRKHAVLRVGESITIEDLGSANGTFVRGAALLPNTPTELAFGQTVDLGSVMLLVQRNAQAGPVRRVWTHGYFELRVEDECQRAARSGTEFGLLRIHLIEPSGSSTALDLLAELLSEEHIIGAYGPGELEVLLMDQAPEAVAELAERVASALGDVGDSARVGVACFPRDGKSPHALLGRANACTREAARAEVPSSEAIVASDAMQELHRLVKRVAVGKISVLILGETGVGKEVLAWAVHRQSPRADQPFLPLNCAAFSETLLESELFGHEKGAFTGANQSKQGLLETADGGTVFLDEVGDLPMSLQGKLLRVLEEKQVLRVGALKPRKIDVRFLAATNRNLEAAAEAGSFRADLMYRLNGVTLLIPPLRERIEEIEPLARTFAEMAARELELSQPPELSMAALDALRAYSWPGNIRELRNFIERAVLLADEVIGLEHLPTEKMQVTIAQASPAAQLAQPAVQPASADVDQRERIVDALQQCAGNQTRAAELLGISRRTLVTWMVRYDVPRPTKR